MVEHKNHIWTISNLCCKFSVTWLAVKTIFGELVIFTVILRGMVDVMKKFGESNVPYNVFQ